MVNWALEGGLNKYEVSMPLILRSSPMCYGKFNVEHVQSKSWSLHN